MADTINISKNYWGLYKYLFFIQQQMEKIENKIAFDV